MRDADDDLLEPALTAAHRALVRLDDEDVPAALRPVRSATKKHRLPPPLRRVLLRHLDEGWLRTLALAELVRDDDAAHEASRLFLERPEGWEERVGELRHGREEHDLRLQVESERAEQDRLRRVVDELGERLAERDARIAELIDRLESDQRVEALRRRLDRETADGERLRAELAERAAETDRLVAELAEADERISVLRTRSQRSGTEGDVAVTARTFGRGNPLETARFLDELAAALRPSPSASPTRSAAPPFALPAGIRPDSVEAIEWIMTVEGRVSLLVDGHNVAHDLDPQPGRTARDRVVSEVARIRRLAAGAVSPVVFFDTDRGAEVHQNSGVSVRYVADADAAIEQAAASMTGRRVVISTDRDVRARAREHGAIALWGTALSSWIVRR